MSQTYSHDICLWQPDMSRYPQLSVGNGSKCSAGSLRGPWEPNKRPSAALDVPPQSSLPWRQILPPSYKNVTTGKPECHCIWKPKIMRNRDV